MKLDKVHSVFFIGIGGIGMSALARYFKHRGAKVAGYDRTETSLTKTLVKEGIPVHYEDDITQIPDKVDLVVYTPAIPKNHKQLNYFLSENMQVLKRSEVLEIITANKFTIAVAGSHGKTTVTSMMAHVLNHTGYGCTGFLGGIALNYSSNFIPGNEDVIVVEADEFDRSFLRLNPDIAILTAVDTDHLDIYGTRENIEHAFLEFTNKVKPQGKVLAEQHVSINSAIRTEKELVTYGDEIGATYLLGGIEIEQGTYHFNVQGPGSNNKYTLGMGGRHNVLNATAVIAVTQMLKIDPEKVNAALRDFQGIRRRFEYVFQDGQSIFIDDYAHHPEEIRMLLNAVRELYPKKEITAVFQPHLFSRTRDLYQSFAEALDMADTVVVLPIYPARELPIDGVGAEMVLDAVTKKDKHLVEPDKLVDFLKDRDMDVLLTIGAGDIDKLVPKLRELLANRDKTLEL